MGAAAGRGRANGRGYVLALDTSNEVVAVGLGLLHAGAREVECVAHVEEGARRASNTRLLPCVDALLADVGVRREDVACVAVGRGPGSFTGVRIAMATAKGVASALGVGLVGVSSLDAVAWNAQVAGARGQLAVVADAMRKEVYPVRFELSGEGVERLEADRVVKADSAARELAPSGAGAALQLAGDALRKYRELFEPCGRVLDERLWTPTGRGLLLAFQAAWRVGDADPFDARRHDPAFALPVYTRLSDAEENERIRLSKNDPKNLTSGVQDAASRRDQRATMHDSAVLNARADARGIVYKPLDAAHAADVAALESLVMGSDAWNASMVADELPRPDRVWWAAYSGSAVLPNGGPIGAAATCGTQSSPLSRPLRGPQPAWAEGGAISGTRSALAHSSATCERDAAGANGGEGLSQTRRSAAQLGGSAVLPNGGPVGAAATCGTQSSSLSRPLRGPQPAWAEGGAISGAQGGSAVLANGGPIGAADASAPRSPRDPEGLRTEVRGALAIPRISGTQDGSAVLTNGGPVGAADVCGTQSSPLSRPLRGPQPAWAEGGAISGTTGALAHSSATCGRDAADGGDALAICERDIAGGEGPSATFGRDAAGEDASVTCGDGDAAGEDGDRAASGAGGLRLVGYAGGLVVDGQVQILKIGVHPGWRRRGIARELLGRVAADARDLGASRCTLEVRAGNAGAQAFYRALGFRSLGVRPRYYSDREDALILEGPLPLAQADVAGMTLHIDEARDASVAPAGALSPAGEDAPADAPAPAGAPAPVSVPAASDALAARRPLILAIESSCDETAAAVVDGSGALVADVVASQIDFHARFGGVVPEIASRKHIEAVCGVCDECLEVASAHLGLGDGRLTWRDLDAVGVTYAPGLVGALVVGVAFAKGAAWGAQLPFIGVNHLEGHLYANKIGAPDFQPPAVVSLVSGGNTMLVHMRGWGDYETLGATIDDAVGEAFDKVAKALGLGYPGGPVISEQAAQGDPDAIAFPRAMMHSGDLRFSLSGLKTAVVTYINSERAAGRALSVPDICASFQQAVVDVQVKKAQMALEQTGAPTFCLGGGVAANPELRRAYEQLCARMGVRLVMPPLSACGDNAGMIALVALDRYRAGRFFGLDADAYAHANLDEPY